MNPTTLTTFARNLRKYRIDARLTQKELAKKIFASRTTVCHWERGRYAPHIAIIENTLAPALGVDASLLFAKAA